MRGVSASSGHSALGDIHFVPLLPSLSTPQRTEARTRSEAASPRPQAHAVPCTGTCPALTRGPALCKVPRTTFPVIFQWVALSPGVSDGALEAQRSQGACSQPPCGARGSQGIGPESVSFHDPHNPRSGPALVWSPEDRLGTPSQGSSHQPSPSPELNAARPVFPFPC